MNSCFRWLLLLLLLHRASETLAQNDVAQPIVETALGQIQGTTMTSQYGSVIYAFRGIPYALPPVNNLRFAPPQAATPWNGTLKATSDSLVCPQPGIQLLMSEDCLKLNVFTRNLTGNAPVIVYIHGGANVLGSGHSQYEAGPQYLLDHDVVFVAFNYRLGALGFLSTRTKEAPGNFGYLDQVLALKWIQEHIGAFGGNAQLVTIFGLSAGSMAVTLHLASPLSKGLFHRAIAMSGAATNHYDIDNLAWTRKLARETSCPMYNPKDVVDCLRKLSWKTIINVCTNWEPYGFTNMKWNYEIDGYFLTAHPSEMLMTGDFNKVPLLVGITRDELDFSISHLENNTELLNDISVSFNLYAPEMFLYSANAEMHVPPVSQRIQKFYLANISLIQNDNLHQMGQIFSDAIIGHGVHRLVEIVHQHVDVFYYRMDYVGQRSLYVYENGDPKGVGHADDLQYILPSLWYGTQFKIDHPDMFMVDRITSFWTTFAKYGAPQTEYNGQWEPTKASDSMQTLYIDRETKMGAEHYPERYALWDDMFPKVSSGAAGQINFLTLGVALIRIIISVVN